MGGIMMPPPPPMNTKPLSTVQEIQLEDGNEDDMSDIVSVSGESFGGDLKEVKVSAAKKRGGGRKKKTTEVSL
jgi:hypothetical protein